MGNSSSSRSHFHHHRPRPPAPPLWQPNQYVFAAPTQYPNPNSVPLPSPYPLPPPPHQQQQQQNSQGYHRYPSAGGGACLPVPTVVEQQKTVTIKNEVNIKKDSIRVEEDEAHPGQFLVAFTFDAVSPGRISVVFFAQENSDGTLIETKREILNSVAVSFEEGLNQKFRQPSGTGIDFSKFEGVELQKENDDGVCPLAVKAEACTLNDDRKEANSTGNSQITLALFDKKENDKYLVRVIKQILWVNGTRYEIQEIYGIGNTVDVESDGNDSGRECVICLQEPPDTTVLPCRHMCMCSMCAAKALQSQSKKCPICRQPVERLLEIKVNEGADDGGKSPLRL